MFTPTCCQLVDLHIEAGFRQGAGGGGEIEHFATEIVQHRTGIVKPLAAEHLPEQAALGPHAPRRTHGHGRGLQPVAAVHVRAVALGKGRGGQRVGGPLRKRRREQVLHDQERDLLEPPCNRFLDPRSLVTAGNPHAAELGLVKSLEKVFEREHLVHEVTKDLLDTAAIGRLFGRDDEPAGKLLVFADRRHGPHGQHRLRIDRPQQLGQQVGLFHAKKRREHAAQSAGGGKFALQFLGQAVPVQIDRLAVLAKPRSGQPLLVVDVMVAVAALVADPPLVDVADSRGA